MQRYIVNINILGQDKRNAFDVEQVFVQPSAGNGQFVVDEETRERSQKSQDTAKKDAGFNASQIEQEEEEAEEIRKWLWEWQWQQRPRLELAGDVHVEEHTYFLWEEGTQGSACE